MTEITNPLIQRLAVLFSEPDSPDPAKFLAEYQRLVAPFPANVLQRAGDILVRGGGRQWPTPKQLIDACVDASDAVSAAGARQAPKGLTPWELQAQQSVEWADRYMAINPLADQARREGWHRELKSYAKSYARETMRGGNQPVDPTRYRPPGDQVAYYRRIVCGLGSAVAK